MKRLAILGSTGTIGRNALDVVRGSGGKLVVSVVAAGSDWRTLAAQAREFSPALAVISDSKAYKPLKAAIGSRSRTRVACGLEGLVEAATHPETDLVLSAVSGTSGILPTFCAAKAGKDIALANKESLVSGGTLIMNAAAASGSRIVPVDSEHSALFQILNGLSKRDVRKLYLPASGGPFLNFPLDRLNEITVADALNHPVWRMGRKITIDSATLANKGLEVIEAHHLFDIGFDRIGVVIHPQCIVHGMVELRDGAVMAHLGKPDMKLPIAYAFSYPERRPAVKTFSFDMARQLTFMKVDAKRFPFLGLAYAAGKAGKTVPAVFNAADEAAVEAFLAGKIGFGDIYETVFEAVESHRPAEVREIADILRAEEWGRKRVAELLGRRRGRRRVS